jgi:hypothetical protein
MPNLRPISKPLWGGLTHALDPSWCWIVVSLALQCGVGSQVQLSPDEAHYALYAQHLDWSYFDHPPMVGWLQFVPLTLGASDWLMRCIPTGAWLLACAGVLRLSDTLWPGHEPRLQLPAWLGGEVRADALLMALSPLPHLLGLALVPDSLLMALMPPLAMLTWRLSQADRISSHRDWLRLGLILGLAGLSKYTALLWGLSVAGLLLHAQGMTLLLTRGPWLALGVAVLLISPVLAWNASHQWVSLAYQLNHASGGGSWRAFKVILFLLLQALAYGVLLFTALRPALGQLSALITIERRRLSPATLLGVMGLAPMLIFALGAAKGNALPHWTAPAWILLMPLAAQQVSVLFKQRPRLVMALMNWQAFCCLGLAALMAGAGWSGEEGAQALAKPGELTRSAPINPFADLWGWRDAAKRASELAAGEGLNHLAVMNWSLASRIAWYARPWPVWVVESHHDQFDLWFGNLAAGDSALVIDWSLLSYAPPVGPGQFARCDALPALPVMRAGRQIAHFNFLACRSWRGGLVDH